MGVLSDLVVAGSGDATLVLQKVSPAAELGGIDIKGIDTVKFSTLHAIVSGRPFTDIIGEYEPTAMASDEGPWVTRIPQELVARLGEISPEERGRIAARWAATEEFRLDRWDAPDVAAALDAICELAARSITANGALFLWMSL